MTETLRDYFDRIEASFCRHRGAPLLLSPLDFEKALEWHAAGIPVEAVEEGIADYFQRLGSRKVPPKRAVCLAFSEDCVLKAVEARRAAAVGRAAGLEQAEPAEVRVERFLRGRIAALRAFADDPSRTASTPVLSRFASRAADALVTLSTGPSQPMTRLESVLAPLDRELRSLALLECPPDRTEAWKREALDRLGDLAGGMDPDALGQTVEKLACQSALAALGLPRLSLLYMEA